ncbi:MAG: hypothetical protein SW833_24655 [Cyanobacteriota bacterium]|nr:hypothetical protein [Cyanobacteriota bacterium]
MYPFFKPSVKQAIASFAISIRRCSRSHCASVVPIRASRSQKSQFNFARTSV